MNQVIIIFTLLLISASSVAADKDKDTVKQPLNAPGVEATKEGSRQEIHNEKKAPEWPRPYKPSEKISVDSIVPFPTDI